MKHSKLLAMFSALSLTVATATQAYAKSVEVVIDRGDLTLQVGGTDATELSVLPKGDCSDKVVITETADQIKAKSSDAKCPNGAKLLLKVAAGDDVLVKLANGMIALDKPNKALESINKLTAKVQAGMIQSAQTKVWINRVNFSGAEAKYKTNKVDASNVSLSLVLTNGLIQF
jgi:hypothetical protein